MVIKFFDVVLKFEPPNPRFLNFHKNSAPVLIRLVLINGDYVYVSTGARDEWHPRNFRTSRLALMGF